MSSVNIIINSKNAIAEKTVNSEKKFSESESRIYESSLQILSIVCEFALKLGEKYLRLFHTDNKIINKKQHGIHKKQNLGQSSINLNIKRKYFFPLNLLSLGSLRIIKFIISDNRFIYI